MLVNGVVFGLVAGYLAHQISQFGAGWKPEAEKATLDNRLKSLIKWSWVEGQAEQIVNGTVDALAAVLKDESDVKQLLIDLEEKDWIGTVEVIAKLIATGFNPTTDEGKLVAKVATDALLHLTDSPAASPAVVVSAEVTAHASPLVEDDHVATHTPA